MRTFRRSLFRLLFTPQHPRRRLLSGLLTGAIVGALVVLAQWVGLFSDIRTRLTDNLYNPRPTTGIVTIVAIDDASLGAYGRSTTQWPRSIYTELVDRLNAAGARVIAFDVLFAEPTEDDAALAEAMKAARNVIQPVLGDKQNVLSTTRLGERITYDRYVAPTPVLADAARILGHANIITDDDGQVRRVPLLINYGDTQLPALGLAAYMQYLRIPTLQALDVQEDALRFAGRTLYTDGIGQMLITYFGPPSRIYGATRTFPVYSVVDVLEDRVPMEVFAGQIVLIGALDAAGLPDNYTTPATHTGEKMFGVEIHANIIETIHQSLPTVPEIRNNVDLRLDLGVTELQLYRGTARLPFYPLPKTEQMALTFGLALAMGLVLPFLRWYVGLLLALLTYGAYFVWVSISLTIWGRLTDLFFPAMAIGATFMATLIVIYVFEERRRTQIHDLFSRYVSSEIAQKIVEAFDQGKLELGGEEREITVLFADIRGFTSISEGLSPTEVVALLNVFLEEMNTIVLKYGGAINKYMGDNLMAFWNAPYPQRDHAWLATQAALEMLAAVKRLNETRHFATPVQFGIGITTGPVVVGNIGSQRRLEYTPIGDTVNVASRLCGVAPGGVCYINEGTYAQVQGRVTPSATQHVQLKGKQAPVLIYELHAPGAEPASAPTPVPAGL